MVAHNRDLDNNGEHAETSTVSLDRTLASRRPRTGSWWWRSSLRWIGSRSDDGRGLLASVSFQRTSTGDYLDTDGLHYIRQQLLCGNTGRREHCERNTSSTR